MYGLAIDADAALIDPGLSLTARADAGACYALGDTFAGAGFI